MAVKRDKFENVLFHLLFFFAFAVFHSHPPPPFSSYRSAYDIGVPTKNNILFNFFYYVYGARKIRLFVHIHKLTNCCFLLFFFHSLIQYQAPATYTVCPIFHSAHICCDCFYYCPNSLSATTLFEFNFLAFE